MVDNFTSDSCMKEKFIANEYMDKFGIFPRNQKYVENILTIEELMRYIWTEWLINVALVIYLADILIYLIRV